MSPLAGLYSTRWILLAAIAVVSVWLWQQPAQLRAYQLRISQTSSGFIPFKLYETDAVECTDHQATDRQPILPNPSAPLVPALKGSAKDLASDIYNPYPEYNTRHWRKKWKGSHAPCIGPRGVEVNDNPDDILKAYRLKEKVPRPMIGSYRETGLESDFCLDRHARYDPYGYEDEFPDAEEPHVGSSKVEWKDVRWGQLQRDCLARNEDRYEPIEEALRNKFRLPTKDDQAGVDSTLVFASNESNAVQPFRLWQQNRQSYKEKSAMVLRTWEGNEWTTDTIQYVRSLIMELALHSGAEYEVIILVEVKDITIPIFEDEEAYRQTLLKSVPDEFGDITIIFNRVLLEKWYPKVGAHNPVTSQTKHMHIPLELLSLLRPDIDYFWQAELDARYTGHHYHHLETIRAWAANEPRRLQWERAARYYVPSVHGTWSDFSQTIAKITKGGGVWGPVKTSGIEPIGPEPPTATPEEDNFEWGVGEEADFINLAPVFDVEGSGFLFKNFKAHYPDGPKTPARATATVPMSRFSKRLLRAMYHGQASLGIAMFPEMFPESTALHHGLKLVVFPLPVYMDYAKNPEEIERTFNADEGKTLLNPPYRYSDIWRRMTYWHSMSRRTTFPDELYKRWLGYSNDPLERVCLPGIVLHPVKAV